MAKDVITRLKVETSQQTAALTNSQREWNKFKNSIGDVDGALKGAISSFAKIATVGATVTAAIKVAKDAFFANEQQLDSWGRTVESSHALYDGFLKALNSGDISGYLSNIDQIVDAAKKAYDAMDELGTFNAFNQRGQLKARHDFQNAINNYREGNGSKEDVQNAANKLIGNLDMRGNKERNAYQAKIREVAAENNVDAGKLYNLLVGSYGNYNKAKNVQPTGVKATPSYQFGGQVTYSYEKYAQTPAERMGQALRAFNDTQLQEIQALGAQEMQTAIEIEGVRRQTDRAINGRVYGKTGTTGGGKGGHTGGGGGSNTTYGIDSMNLSDINGGDIQYASTTESMNSLKAELSQWEAQMGEATTMEAANYIQQMIDECQRKIDAQPLALKLGVSADTAANLQDNITKMGDEMRKNMKPLEIDTNGNTGTVAKDAKQTALAWQNATSAISNAGSALQNLEDPSAKVAGIVMQAIANVALGFAQASASPATGAAGVFGWIAAATAGVATMTATIAQIKSATSSYAEGGMLTGNTYKGDAIPFMGNAGEVVLSAAQTANLAEGLSSAGSGGMQNTHPYVTGQSIYLGLNNYLKGSGKGQLVLSK